MIKKYLVSGKQVYMSSQKPEAHIDTGEVVEILMPTEEYWKAQDLVKEITYLMSAGETASEIQSATRKLYQVCAPYASNEKGRAWLTEKAGETSH